MITLLGNSDYVAQRRVNCESLLSFDGVNQYASAGVNPNILNAVEFDRDWAVSFVYQQPLRNTFTYILSLSDNDSNGYGLWIYQLGNSIRVGFGNNNNERKTYYWYVVPNVLNHIIISYEAASQTLSCTTNTITKAPYQKAVDAQLVQSVYRKTPSLLIAVCQNSFSTLRYSEQLHGSTIFFNFLPSESEAKLLHENPNYLATDDLRRACVAHYVPDREGLILWDVVEQYNWAKFSNEKNGDFENGIEHWPIYLAGGTSGSLTYNATEKSARLEITTVGQDTTGVIGIQQSVLVTNEEYSLSYEYRVVSSPTLKKFQADIGTNRAGGFINASSDGIWRERTVTGIANTSSLRIYIINNPSQAFNVGDIVEFRNVRLRHTTNPELESYHATLQNFTPTQVEGSGQDAYLDFYDKTPLRPFVDSDGDGQYDQPLVEKSSLLPPLQNALRFDKASNLPAGQAGQYAIIANFSPGNELGYTFMVNFQLADDFNFAGQDNIFYVYNTDDDTNKVVNLFSVSTTHLRLAKRMNGIGAVDIRWDNITFSPFASVIISVDQAGEAKAYINGRLVGSKYFGIIDMSVCNTLNIGNQHAQNRYFGGYIPQLGIAKGIITPRQVIELWNNSLLANPKSSWKNLDWQLLPNFNQINDNAGTYTLTDNSPQNHTITLSGFTPANLNPQDPNYSLQKINSLR